MSVHLVWAKELDQGRYWCSPRTMASGAELVADIAAEQSAPPGYLHADGGAPATSKP